MASQTTVVSVLLTLDQLLSAVRQWDDTARIQVAKALLEKDLDAKLTALIQRLVKRQPPTELTEALINAEVRAVRMARAAQDGDAQKSQYSGSDGH